MSQRNSLFIKAYAKVNLFLEVMGKRDDGYHEIDTVMQTISLFDIIQISPGRKDNILHCDSHIRVPKGDGNIVIKAVKLVQNVFGIEEGVEITLKKRIPVGGGLGGGSTDAAATLIGLIEFWNLKCSRKTLVEMASSLGSDVVFFLKGGTARATGKGEKVESLSNLPSCFFLVAIPEFSIPTEWVYQNFNLGLTKSKKSGKLFCFLIEKQDLTQIGRNLFNRLEEVVLPNYPDLEEIKTSMGKDGSLGSLVSGSGACVFGLFEERLRAENFSKEFQKKGVRTVLTQTVKKGWEFK